MQCCVSLSNAKAEYTSVYAGSIIFGLFRANRIMCPRFEDYQGATALAENPPGSARNKNIDVRFHIVRGLLRAKKQNQFVASEEQHADTLVKSLVAIPSRSHRKVLLDLPLGDE